MSLPHNQLGWPMFENCGLQRIIVRFAKAGA